MDTRVSPFWTLWLLIVAAIWIALGIAMFATPLVEQVFGAFYYEQYLDAGAYSTLGEQEIRFQHYMYGVMGALTAAWMAALAFIIHVPFRHGEKWAWYAIEVSTALWFIGDSYVSIVTGFAANALVNLGLLLAVGIPLLMTYRQLHVPGASLTAPAEAR